MHKNEWSGVEFMPPLLANQEKTNTQQQTNKQITLVHRDTSHTLTPMQIHSVDSVRILMAMMKLVGTNAMCVSECVVCGVLVEPYPKI